MGDDDKTATFDGGQAGQNTIALHKLPIVLVPGVMGSRLNLVPPSGDAWDPDDQVNMGLWIEKSTREKVKVLGVVSNPNPLIIDKLPPVAQDDIFDNKKLDPLLPANVGTDRADKLIFYTNRHWGQVAWGFYRDILMSLETSLNKKGRVLNPVYACGYDWRKSNDDSAKTLRSVIQDVLSREQAQKVIVVTHSMGGLVTRALLRQGGQSLIHGVVHCCMPSTGTPVAYRRFFTGIDLNFDRVKNRNAVFEPLFASLQAKVLGNSALKWAIMLSELRGPNELLSSDDYPDICLTDLNNDNNRGTLTLSQEYPKTNPPGVGVVPPVGKSEIEFVQLTPLGPPFPNTVAFTTADAQNLRARLAEAAAFHSGFSQVLHPRTCLIAGGAFLTDQEFDWNLGPDRATLGPKIVQNLNGDGTVSLASSEFRNGDQSKILQKKIIGFAEHSTCFSEGPGKQDFLDTTRDFVRFLLGMP